MTKIYIFLLVTGSFVLSGCFRKKPYQAYQTTFKTAGAEQFADKTVDPKVATQKNIKTMTLPEVRAARIYFEKQNDVELIEKTLTFIIKLSDNYQEKADCMYELATIQLSLGRLEKARELFEQISREYPGVAFKNEAAYRQILAHYWDCSDAEHDQEMTEKTLSLVVDFEKNFPHDAQYKVSLETIQAYCYKILFEAELLRMNFYLAKYQVTQEPETLPAAQMRFAYMLEKLIENQKQISSPTKELLYELYLQVKELDPEKQSEKYKLLLKAAVLLAENNEN